MPLRRPVSTTTIIAISTAVLVLSLGVRPVTAQIGATPLQNMQLDASALVLARGGNFSHVINGSPFQQEVLLTYEGYQFASWYHNGAEQDIFLSRRELGGNTWETIDTGYDMEIGNQNWDSHNVISLGISGDGRVHLSYDHHVDPLRYLTTDPGFATSSSQVWSQAGFAPERSSLNSNGSTIPRVSYPRFTNVGDDLVLTYRDYGSGSGDVRIADYDATTGQWSSTRFVNRGRPGNGIYDDVNNNPSDRRNAYHNGFHSDSTGRLHTTWTWREGTQDGNHDINYAYSDDRGVTWRNNDGALVGTSSAPITLDSPGVEIVDLDRRHALLNQQGQIVDPEGVVHALMFHRPKGPTYSNSPFSDRNGSDYHHYYRDPLTGDWQVNQFPSSISVGSRPRIGVDGFGHLFAAYTHNDDLVIVGSEKIAGGYSEWRVLHRDRSRNFEGTPQLDTQRLLEDGVLSLLIQEETPIPSQTLPSGTPLHVREFSTITPTVHTLRSGSADGALRARKLTGEVSGEGLDFVINSDELNVGQSGAGADPFDRAAVMVFQLPDLGSIEDPFQVARFQGHLTQTVSSGGVGGDLYGLARRDAPEILNTDYFGGSDVAGPESVLLEDDLLVEGMPTGTPFVTSAVGGANLVAFLNEQYAGGAGAGDYVFLRLNADADTTQRWSLNSGDVADEMLRPQLLFNALEGDFLNGDYNRDGVVDAADYTVWRDNLGAAAGTLPNDPHGGTIGEGQLVVWRDNYGTTLAASASTSVILPEPGTNGCVLTVILASYALGNRRSERKCIVDRFRGGRMCKATSGDRGLPRGQRRKACLHLASGILLLVLTTALVSGSVLASPLTEPIREPTLSFTERDGMVVVEAEDFFEQTGTQARAFYRTSKHDQPAALPDGDASHHEDASGGVYLEILPDTRRSHGDKLVVGTNFSPEPGNLAVLSYRVALTRPGRYYVWVRAFSTGTEDNGLHVGINGEWPSSGRRMQWTAKHKWYWDSKQRTKEVHTGVPGQIYLDVKRPGVHTVSFSMREDGFEFDKWLMTTDAAMPRPTRAGPPSSPTTR